MNHDKYRTIALKPIYSTGFAPEPQVFEVAFKLFLNLKQAMAGEINK
jgi:hypothetical protein